MADRKSGPVKPPVIELKAREAQGRSTATRTADRKAPAAATGPAAGAPAGAAKPEPAESTARPAAETIETATPVGPATEPAKTAEPAKSTEAAASRPAARHAHADEGADKSASSADGRTERSSARDARSAGTGASAARPAAALPPRPPARLAMPWSAISIAAVVGAILGTLLTYAAVNVLPLPGSGPAFADPTPRLDAMAGGIDDLTGRVADLEASTRKTQVSLDATIAQLDSSLAELRQSIAAIPAPQPVDLSPVEAEIKTLEDRIAAIGAGASSADAEALASNISDLQSGIAELKSGLDRLDQHVGATDTSVAALGTDLAAAKQAIAAQNQTLGGAEVSPAVRLPLVVSGLETAFANGRSYADELNSLTTLLPDLSVPPAVAQGATGGLPRPDLVAQRFSAAMPAILAGRTATAGNDWTQNAVEWVKALLALRPSGEIEGNSPDAVVSRLEAAVNRRDFVGASDLLDQLPPPMRAAAGDVGTDIRELATAEAFLSGLRSQALAPAGTAAADPGAAR